MNNKFKQEILEKVLDNVDKFYIHIMPHKDLIIGARGLIDQEKEKGLLLVFGPYSYKDFQWDDQNIYVSMRFSGKWENLTIPYDAITSIFDDPLTPSFVFSFKISAKDKSEDNQDKIKKPLVEKNDKVIKINFKSKD
ncbi:ClpXP protease specificity-enhancing factor SspB [Deferribacter abyssi]|uniref:ClpXP protease specificity-enhancing factor SspB n=1 Tax=Deferribacter abyssi TaxID=213806 RepID=UPI003C148E36